MRLTKVDQLEDVVVNVVLGLAVDVLRDQIEGLGVAHRSLFLVDLVTYINIETTVYIAWMIDEPEAGL